jgi:hypothetical protein
MLNDDCAHFSDSDNKHQQSTIGNQFTQHSAFSISKFARTIQLGEPPQQASAAQSRAFHWNKRGTGSSAAVNSITSMPFWRYHHWISSLTVDG